MMSRMIFLDLAPLRSSPAFRRLWLGQSLSIFGGYMTTFAVMLQLYNLTHSSLAVGASGLCSALPAMVFVLFGGSIGDAVDRRKLVLFGTTGQMVVSLLFAVQAFANCRIAAVLYALLVLQSVLTAVNAPARRTFLSRLLPRDLIKSGATLNMLGMRFAEMTGPALAGVIASAWGLRACYTVDAVSFLAALYGVGRLPAMPPQSGPSRPTLGAARDGLIYLVRQPLLLGAFAVDLGVTLFGVSTALLPAFNTQALGGSPRTLGLLMAASGVGGLIGSLCSGPLRRVSREGFWALAFGALWGACIALLGASSTVGSALVCLGVAGAADTMLVVLRTTIVQVHTPDAYMARVGGIDYLVGAGGPQLGNLRAGWLGTVFSAPLALVISGLSSVAAVTAIALALPSFRNYRSGTANLQAAASGSNTAAQSEANQPHP